MNISVQYFCPWIRKKAVKMLFNCVNYVCDSTLKVPYYVKMDFVYMFSQYYVPVAQQ